MPGVNTMVFDLWEYCIKAAIFDFTVIEIGSSAPCETLFSKPGIRIKTNELWHNLAPKFIL